MMQNPWKGLAAYREPKADDEFVYKFCGRENAAIELVAQIENNLCVTVYGRTGIGKTSLLEAGVFPKIRQANYLPISVRFSMRDSEDISFAEYIVEQIEKQVEVIRKTVDKKISPLKDGQCNIDFLWEYFATRRFYVKDKEVYPLVVLDQFEENFFLNKQETWELVGQIYSLINDNKIYPAGYHDETNFRVVISIREDDLYRLEDCIDRLRLPDLKFNRYRLVYLTDKEAQNVISIPGNDCLPPEPSDREQLVDEIIKVVKQGNDGEINTLILSLVCSVLFDKMVSKGQSFITLSDVRSLSENPLVDFYLSIASQIPKQRLFLEDRLVDFDGRRNTVNVEEMDLNFPNWRTLLVGSKRILQESNKKVELVHDMLAKAIYDVRLRRQKKKKKRLFQICVLGLAFLMVWLCLFSSVFTLEYDVYDSNPKKKPLYMQKEFVVNEQNDLLPSNPYIRNRIEKIVVDKPKYKYYFPIRELPNLTHLVVKENVRALDISDCPNLMIIDFQCDSISDLDIERGCGSLKTIILPHYIEKMDSEQDIFTVVPRTSDRYVWDKRTRGILWDVKAKKILYSHNDTCSYSYFPYECRDLRCYVYRGDTIENRAKWIDDIMFNEDESEILGSHAFTNPILDLTKYTSLRRIESYAFAGSGIRKIVLKDTVKYNSWAFANCELDTIDLTHIYLGYLADYDCYDARRITYVTNDEGPFVKKNGVVYRKDEPKLLSSEFKGDYLIQRKSDKNFPDTTIILTHGFRYKEVQQKEDEIDRDIFGGIANVNDAKSLAKELPLFFVDEKNAIGRLANLGFTLNAFVKDMYLGRWITRLSCTSCLTEVESIHVSNPNFGGFQNLPDTIRSRITLYVPYGCKHNFAGFKAIKEESLLATMAGNIEYSIEGVLFTFGGSALVRGLFGLGVLIVFLFFAILNFSRIKESSRSFWRKVWVAMVNTAAMLALGLVCWTACYWFVWYAFIENMWVGSAVASVFAIAILFALYYNVLFEVGRIRWGRLFASAGQWMRRFFHGLLKWSTYRDLAARMKGWHVLVFLFAVCLVVAVGLLRSRLNENKYAEHIIAIVEDLSEGDDDDKDKALCVLVNYMEEDRKVSDEIYSRMDSLLHEMAPKQEYERILLEGERTGRVMGIDISPDGEYLASTTNRGFIKIWNLDKRRCVDTVKAFSAYVNCVSFAPEGNLLVYGDGAGYVHWYDWKDSVKGVISEKLRWDINSVAFNKEGSILAAASDDDNIYIWDTVSNPVRKQVLKGHGDWVMDLCFSPDDKYLYSCSEDSTMRKWNLGMNACIDTMRFKTLLECMAINGDGTKVAVSERIGSTYVCNVADEGYHALKQGKGEREWNEDLGFSSDGQRLAVVSQSAIRIWDLTGEIPIKIWEIDEGGYSCCFSPDGSYLYTGDYKGNIHVWSMDEVDKKSSTEFLLEVCKSHLEGISLTDGEREKWKLR